MKTSKRHSVLFIIGLLICFGCKEDPNKALSVAEVQLSKIKAEYAPDKRVALFDVKAEKHEGSYILKGESNLPEAMAALKNRLEADSIPYIDSVQVLPSDKLGKMTRAIVNISVANLRSNPGHSSELATQATLGTVLNVYKQKENWFYVQTPDKYLAWVDEGGVVLVDEQSAENWRDDEKIIYLKTYGHAFQDSQFDGAVISDLTAGGLLSVVRNSDDNFMVRFPDGRNAYVRKNEARPYSDWLETLSPTNENLVATGKTLMGVPYLWGGTSTKGVDCSGFTKTVFFLNGMVIPRDASQQVHTGMAIDSTRNFDVLQRGDLLFFGRKATDSTKEKVVHVGMWIGNKEFIHASGKVRVSSIDKLSPNYDEYNLNRYLRTKRVFKQEGKGLIDLTQTLAERD